MKITDALIERFLNDECDELEKETVTAYFSQYPGLLQKLLTEKSWKDFETSKTLTPAVSEKMLAVIRSQTYRKRRTVAMWYASAAAILVLLFGTYLITRNNQVSIPPIAVVKTTADKSVQYAWQQKINSTGSTISYSLKDGSIVALTPGSKLRYTVPFINNRRDIYLEGVATFHVAKDHTKPFTVYAGRLATTALGTVFKITARGGNTETTVQLYSGKVRVAPDSLLQAQGLQIAYLVPGQELRMDAQKLLAVVHATERSNRMVVAPKPADNDILVFHNEPLGNMFKTLELKFERKIVFQEQLLTGMSFTGTYNNNKESILEFIQTACLLNNLVVREENGIFYITGQ